MLNQPEALQEVHAVLVDQCAKHKISLEANIINDELCLNLRVEDLIRFCKFLRDNPQFRFEQLSDITAVDWPEKIPRFCMVYHLLSVSAQIRLRLTLWVKDGQTVPSVTAIWPAANWYEREVWDMYGIQFDDHPDLRRILTDYGFEGHPQRKDFPLTGHVEMRYDPAAGKCVYEPVSLTQDFRQFDFLSPWAGMTQQPSGEPNGEPTNHEDKKEAG